MASDPVYGNQSQRSEKNPPSTRAAYATSTSLSCPVCEKEGHGVISCEKYVALRPEDRLQTAIRLKLCFVCLRGGHITQDCTSKTRCKTEDCGRMHAIMLHANSNYRPISLTNVDYRILAFILSARLQGVIESIVSPDQTAYIKNRHMGNNIRLVEDILEYYDHMEKKGLIFMADFTKAFDSLEWDFMFRTLDFFRFGPSFKKWIKTMYTLLVGKIKNNGHLSEEFSMTRGVRLGCPISTLIFILSIEILGLKIRQHNDLKGLNLGISKQNGQNSSIC